MNQSLVASCITVSETLQNEVKNVTLSFCKLRKPGNELIKRNSKGCCCLKEI